MNINLNEDVLNFLENNASGRCEFFEIEECFYHYVLYRRENSEKRAWWKASNYTDCTTTNCDEVAEYVEEEILPKCSNFEVSQEIADFVEELKNIYN